MEASSSGDQELALVRSAALGEESPGDLAEVRTEDIEAQLRKRLRSPRLIFEIGVEADEQALYEDRVRSLVRMGHTPFGLARFYPALYSTYLAFTGALKYEGGNFWSSIVSGINEPNSDPGPAFLNALERLDLEKFDVIFERDQHAQIWVSRILAHGGVPRSCLPAFADLLTRERDLGLAGADELISAWSQDPERLQYLHKPTQRFLQYGGATAEDFLDRCLEALNERARTGSIPDSAQSGLPVYILDALAQASAGRRSPGRRRFEAGIPRPWIEIDPYGGLGPAVVLPPVEPDRRTGSWQITSDARTTDTVNASIFETFRIKVPPSRFHAVSFSDEAGTLRRWEFTGLGSQGFMAFDPEEGHLLRGQRAISLADTWLLTPSEATIRVAGATGSDQVHEIAELPAMADAWSAYDLTHVDLDEVNGIELELGGVITWVPVTKPNEKPRLSGESPEGVFDGRGNVVYTEAPAVRLPYAGRGSAGWTVALGDSTGYRIERVEPGVAEVDLTNLFPDLAAGTFSLKVKGPLGSDLNTAFSIVPGLRVDRPTRLTVSDEANPEVTVGAGGASVDGHSPGEALTKVPDPSESGVLFRLTFPGAVELDLRVVVPRLLWTVIHDTKLQVAPNTFIDRVGKEEFDDALADFLHVQTGIPDVHLWLELFQDGNLMGSSPSGKTQGRDGRWSFDLSVFADAIRMSKAGMLTIDLVVGSERVTAARIVARVKPIEVECVTDPDGTTHIMFEKTREVFGLTARLWSTLRPADHPITTPVDDSEISVSFPAGSVPPGPYELELDVVEDFVLFAPKRPPGYAQRTEPVTVGDPTDLESQISEAASGRAELDFVRALVGLGAGDGEVSGFLPIAGEIAVAAIDLAAGPDPDGTRATRVFGLLEASDMVLATGLVRAAAVSDGEQADRAMMTMLAARIVARYESTFDELPDELMEELWDIAAPVACLLELPWAQRKGQESLTSRCDNRLMWLPEDQPIFGGGRVDTEDLEATSERLSRFRAEAIKEAVLGAEKHKSSGILDPPELRTAITEALIAEKGARSPFVEAVRPAAWVEQTKPDFLGEEVELLLGERGRTLARHLHSRRGPQLGGLASLPQRTLIACAHVAWNTEWNEKALTALNQVIPYAHRLVEHDLILAMAIDESTRRLEEDSF